MYTYVGSYELVIFVMHTWTSRVGHVIPVVKLLIGTCYKHNWVHMLIQVYLVDSYMSGGLLQIKYCVLSALESN